MITLNSDLIEFMQYVFDFYGKGNIYANFFEAVEYNGTKFEHGAMIYEIVSCASLYYDWGNKNDKWGGGDSFDREFVRDMMLYGRGIRLEDLEFGKGVGEFIKEFTEDRKTIEIDLSLN